MDNQVIYPNLCVFSCYYPKQFSKQKLIFACNLDEGKGTKGQRLLFCESQCHKYTKSSFDSKVNEHGNLRACPRVTEFNCGTQKFDALSKADFEVPNACYKKGDYNCGESVKEKITEFKW